MSQRIENATQYTGHNATHSALQSHSVGDTYPLIVSVISRGNAGECYVWNGLTGERFESFPYVDDMGEALHNAEVYAQKLSGATQERVENPPALSEHTARFLANLALRRLKQTGGFSINARGENAPLFGYMVSLAGHEQRAPFSPALSVVSRYFQENTLPNGAYWGGWRNVGATYLDVSLWAQTAGEALTLAQDHKQRAVYDCTTGESIFID